jgi:hypothetical protein
MQILKTYKAKIASRYIPVNAEEAGNKIAGSRYYLASVKYDGHLTFLHIENGTPTLFNSSSNVIEIPSILKAAHSIKQDCILVCE